MEAGRYRFKLQAWSYCRTANYTAKSLHEALSANCNVSAKGTLDVLSGAHLSRSSASVSRTCSGTACLNRTNYLAYVQSASNALARERSTLEASWVVAFLPKLTVVIFVVWMV